MKRRRLLNPGPVTLAPSVRAALASAPDLCHREPEFAALQQSVRNDLATLYESASDYAATLLTGSGTAAVESMLTSLVPDGAAVLIAANGVYGQRMAAMAARAGIDHVVVESGMTDPIDFVEVARRLQAHPEVSHIAAVHHETTIGRLNELGLLAEVAAGRPILLDAVSSFGAEDIRFAEWNIEACAATANKCLHGVPGIAFVVAQRAALLDGRRRSRSVYLDLRANHEAQENGYPQFTPAVQSLIALSVALQDLDAAGGWQGRGDRYRSLMNRVRSGLAAGGVEALLGPADNAASLTSFRLPDGHDFEALFQPLSAVDFVIYPGQRELYREIFRVAVMGDLSDDDIEELVGAFGTILS
ncbi:MAG: aminotransferase class V-fold PLP-dependent enzyme [Acidimicrobiia bacterium]|nr:aminotransferase class V-fold PLP-dependent enzyme [Acidimicrobiia bacterium]